MFRTLYQLAFELLTARPASPLYGLTLHHYTDAAQAHQVLRAAILQRTMPGESPETPWGLLRIFMRNLVNRAQAPIKPDDMLGLLGAFTKMPEADRHEGLLQALEGNKLHASLSQLLSQSGLAWLQARLRFYRQLEGNCRAINADDVIRDVQPLGTAGSRKIPNMGVPLAANLFADCGARAFAKPDLHVKPVVYALMGRKAKDEDCIRFLINAAQRETLAVAADPEFAWLDGGLYPRDLDRLIYLIGSNNFLLDGQRMKRGAPARRELMIKRLLDPTPRFSDAA